MKYLKVDIIQTALELVGEVDTEDGGNIPDIKFLLTFKLYVYIVTVYIRTMRDNDLNQIFFREPVKYGREFFRVVAMVDFP